MSAKRITDLRAYIEKMSMPVPECGCWLWLGPLSKKGYGQWGLQSKDRKAHRQAWVVYHGEIPVGMFVLHRCDIPCCVNPDHLWLGTHDDNMRDMVDKGRSASQGKLPRRDSPEMGMLLKSPENLSIIASRFGVSKSTILRIQKKAPKPTGRMFIGGMYASVLNRAIGRQYVHALNTRTNLPPSQEVEQPQSGVPQS